MGTIRCFTLLFFGLWASLVQYTTCTRVLSVSHSGNGCPQSSTVDWWGDVEDLTFQFPDFNFQVVGGTDTLSCQVHVQIDQGPPGQRLNARTAYVRGRFDLDPQSDASVY